MSMPMQHKVNRLSVHVLQTAAKCFHGVSHFGPCHFDLLSLTLTLLLTATLILTANLFDSGLLFQRAAIPKVRCCT